MLLQMHNLCVDFKTSAGTVRAVDGVCLDLESGKTLCVVGESGSGKSVTAMSILGLLEENGFVESGEILFEENGKKIDLTACKGEEMRKIRGNKISVVFQEPMTALNPVLTIAKQLSEPFIIHQGMRKKQAIKAGEEILKKVQIPNVEQVLKSYPHQLSGGMRQRVMIAIALACQPKILIADEPTTALDVTIQAQILQLMKELQKTQNASILFITHDLGVVSEMADEVAVMYLGRIVEKAKRDEIFFNEKYSHPYTEGLLASMPSQKTRGKELKTIRGNVPAPNRLPSGCKFSSRCEYCTEKCTEKEPPLYDMPTGQKIRCYYPEKEERQSAKHQSLIIRPRA
jgi:peptide/nickel transport system ATP-binding protein